MTTTREVARGGTFAPLPVVTYGSIPNVLDIPNLINQTGDVLEEQKTEPGLFVFRILKRAHGAPKEQDP